MKHIKKYKNNMLNIFGSMVLKKLREVLRKFFSSLLVAYQCTTMFHSIENLYYWFQTRIWRSSKINVNLTNLFLIIHERDYRTPTTKSRNHLFFFIVVENVKYKKWTNFKYFVYIWSDQRSNWTNINNELFFNHSLNDKSL